MALLQNHSVSVKVLWSSSHLHQENTHLGETMTWSPNRRVSSLTEAVVLAGFPAGRREQAAFGLSLMQSPAQLCRLPTAHKALHSCEGCPPPTGFR